MRPNALAALVAYIGTDFDLILLVGNRIYAGELPHDETPDMPRACIVINHAGGPGSRDYLKIGEMRIDVKCYGETLIQASEVYNVLSDFLKNIRRIVQDDILLHRLNESGGPTLTRDPAIFWPYVISTWMLLASEYQIT